MRITVGLLLIILASCVSKPSQSVINTNETPAEKVIESNWSKASLEILEVKGYYPKFLKNGTGIIYSDSNYKGLKLYLFDTKKELQVTEARGAGYRPVILAEHIIYEVKSRKSHFERIDLASMKTQELSAPREASRPGVFTTISPNLGVIDIFSDGKLSSSISPGDFTNYLYSELSPDGTRVLFEVSGRGGYLSDLAGEINEELGDLDHPRWISDSEIVFAKTSDDGMKTTSSKLMLKNLETGNELQLAQSYKNNLFNPDASSSGNMIIANSAEGEIVIITKN